MVNRNKNIIKYLVFPILLLFLLYNSVYFEKLDRRKHTQASKQFHPVEYVQEFWHNRLLPNLAKSTPITELIPGFNTNIEDTGQTYGRTLGLASTNYFL